MEPKLKITNATVLEDHILVEYKVVADKEIIATGSKKYSLNTPEEIIEKHLKRILKTKAYETPAIEPENPLDKATITAEALKDRVIIKS